jgi:hypothetical protein
MKTSLANLVLCAAALALPPLAADAQDTFRCTDRNGKKHYGNTIPPQCQNRAVEQLNSQGMVVKRIDPEATEREKAAAEKNKVEREKLEAINRETQRRDRALLATYTSEKDIEDQRARALDDHKKAVTDQETRVTDLKKKRASYDKEMEFYQDKKGGTKLPPKLQEEIRQAEFDLKVQQDSLEVKKKEVDNINAKYDDDKKRYLALTKRR